MYKLWNGDHGQMPRRRRMASIKQTRRHPSTTQVALKEDEKHEEGRMIHGIQTCWICGGSLRVVTLSPVLSSRPDTLESRCCQDGRYDGERLLKKLPVQISASGWRPGSQAKDGNSRVESNVTKIRCPPSPTANSSFVPIMS